MTTRVRRFRELMKKERQQAIDSVKFYYWLDDYRNVYRVWQVGTPGDVFDVFDARIATLLIHFFKQHPDMFVNEEPPEDDEG